MLTLNLIAKVKASDIVKASGATHTFILVTDKNGKKHRFAYGALEHPIAANIGIGGRLQSITYPQDTDIITGKNTDDLKAIITVAPPKNMSEEEFDQKVIDVAKLFGNNEGILYRIDGGSNANDTYGNCNSSTSTILLNAGVPKEQIEKIKNKIPGKKWGFESTAKPWTKEEQQKAVDNRKLDVFDTTRIILSSFFPLNIVNAIYMLQISYEKNKK